MNPAAMKGSGLTEDCYGKLIEEVYPQEKADLLNSMYSQTVEGASPTHFTTNGHMVGESILSPVFNNEGLCTHVFSVTRDITERKNWSGSLSTWLTTICSQACLTDAFFTTTSRKRWNAPRRLERW